MVPPGLQGRGRRRNPDEPTDQIDLSAFNLVIDPKSRIVIYARQSRDMDSDGTAVSRQIELSLEKLGPSVPVRKPIVDNDISATSGAPRPGYQQLLTLIRERKVDTIVAYHLDRLLRSLAEMEELIPLAEAYGVKIITVVGDIDLSTDMGQLVGRILASVAAGEVKRKGRRQRDKNRQKALDGKRPKHPNFGHPRNFRVNGESVAVPAAQVAREREAVAEGYRLLLAKHSTRHIARVWNEGGFRTTLGNEWERTSVRNTLMSSIHAGIRTFKGEVVGKGEWDPIVSEAVWHAAVAILSSSERLTNAGNNARRWLGGGLYWCGRCDDSDMFSNYKKDRVRIYRCRKHNHNMRRADAIDEYVLAAVAKRLDSADLSQLVRDSTDTGEIARLSIESQALQVRKKQLGLDYARELLTGDQVHVATQDIDLRLADIADKLAAIGKENALAHVLAGENRGERFLADELEGQRITIDAMCTVTLLPNTRGRWADLADTIDLRWKVG